MAIKVDTRLFKYAGTSCNQGEYKARFANNAEVRVKVLQDAEDTDIVLYELPEPLTKSEAIAFLKEANLEGINIGALEAKEQYIANQLATIEKASLPKAPKAPKAPKVEGRKRGRPPLSDEVKAARAAEREAQKSLKAPKAPKTPKAETTEDETTVEPVSSTRPTSVVNPKPIVGHARAGSIRAKAQSAHASRVSAVNGN